MPNILNINLPPCPLARRNRFISLYPNKTDIALRTVLKKPSVNTAEFTEAFAIVLVVSKLHGVLVRIEETCKLCLGSTMKNEQV